MPGLRFVEHIPSKDGRTDVGKLLPLFLELLAHSGGDAEEALNWMDELNKEHGFYSQAYARKEFDDDLRKHGVLGHAPRKGGKATHGSTSYLGTRFNIADVLICRSANEVTPHQHIT